MENETDEVVSGVSTLSMAVERSGPLSFADICDLGAEVAGTLADEHDEGRVHGHVAVGSVVRLDAGPWRLAPSELVPDVDPVPAPELADGGPATPAGDVYALGAVLSYGLTGIAVEPVTPGSDGGAPDAAPVVDTPAASGEGRIGVDPDGEPTLELSADDLDRLRTFGERPAPSEDADPEAAAADGAGAPADEAGGDPGSIDLTDDPVDGDADAPMTLPEVMSSFLVVLRSSLADDPADRPSASSLAATLRQLRSDADSALGGALVVGAAAGVAAVTIGDAAGAEAWGDPGGDAVADAPPPLVAAPEPAPAAAAAAVTAAAAADGALTVEGTGSSATLGAAGAKVKTKKSFKDRAPVVVAVAAVVVAAVLGVSLVRERNDKDSDLLAVGPTVGTTVRRSTTTSTPALPVDLIVETTTTLPSSTTSSTSTTAPTVQEVVVDTTVPTTSTTVPTTTPDTSVPLTTTTSRPPSGISATVVCGSGTVPCPAKIYSDPSTQPPSAVKGDVPNGTIVTVQCAVAGELVGTSNVWLRLAGQGDAQWMPKAALTYSQTPPPCPT